DVYEEQVRTIETKSGEFVHIMIRPDRDVHSITARLYASSTARVSQAVTWKEHLRDLFTLRPVYAETMPTAWLSGYVFSPLPVSRVYASTVTLSDLRPGTYRLAVSINGIDGSRTHIMKTIQVNAKGVVYAGTNTADHRVRDAKLTLYHQDETGAFSVWKGERFQERNPKLSDVDGTYSFSVPQGRYYVSVLVQGYEEYTSGIIVVSSTGFIDQDISLTKKATESWWQHFWMWVGHRIAG
ncbi:MAG TPA: carboxypeptidase-like regulatory domain-containing protein, partial [Candidatus Kapabacteria bacterium]|nr:carboxypeptidase-like regulatory domain-containing protein [Candidatus Kapabacteria bacterium]